MDHQVHQEPGGRAGNQGHQVSHHSVGKLLAGPLDYSLQGNAKTLEGRQHPDRDAQFRYIARRVTAALAAGEPVISVDAKKKELIGRYARAGREWRPSGDPRRADVHDFPGEQGKAVPYGVYDLALTPAGCRWAATATPPSSPSRPSGAGGTALARSLTPVPRRS